MATIDLGKIRFNWQGAYNNSTAYVINDVVSSGGNSYICKLASTGNAVSNGTYWDLMSSAGTNGTDLTSTLTTQGDVLYRDGSGLQRLAKPVSDKFLKNTSGGVVSWDDAGGGSWNLLQTITASNSASIEFTSNIDSTYASYVFVLVDLTPATDNDALYMVTSSDGGSSYAGAFSYANGTHSIFHNGVVTSSTVAAINTSGVIELVKSFYAGNATGESLSGQINMYGPSATTQTKFTHTLAYNNQTGDLVQNYGAAMRKANAIVNAVKFYFVSGNTVSGTFKLYGIS